MFRGVLRKSFNAYSYLKHQKELPNIIIRKVSNFDKNDLIKSASSNIITSTSELFYYDNSDDIVTGDIKELKDKYINKNALITKVKQITFCNQQEAEKIVEKFGKELRTVSNITSINNVNILKSRGTTTDSIIENPFLLFMNTKSLKLKLDLLELYKLRNINDCIPLMKIPIVKLNYIVKLSQRELAQLSGTNRVYFLSDKINLPPPIVAKYLSTHPFMFEIALDSLVDNLNIFLKYKVAPINIVRDLWAFKYTAKAIEARLERAKEAQKDKIMPWMVRCPENILAKSLQISVESKAVLGDNDSVIDYLSKRLGYDHETTRYIVMKHPIILTVRITKIKEILDYLLNETEFTEHHIALVPRILCHGLATTKHRINELKSFGCVPSSLIILCKSRAEYKKFLDNWISVKNKIRNIN